MTIISEPTRLHLERMRQYYDQHPTEINWTGLAYRNLLAHYYNLLIPANASVLEIGCGSGELLSQLKARQLTGVDLSKRQIESAQQRLPNATF